MEKIKKLEAWQRPASGLQIKNIIASRGAVNLVTFEDFLNGKNPNYQSVAGKISFAQIERLKRFVERVEKGEYSHINFETTERFLKKEKPFGKDYFSLKKFAEKNKNKFCIWDSVFYELKDLAFYPVKVTSYRSLSKSYEVEKKMNLKSLLKNLGDEKILLEKTPKIYETTNFLKFNSDKIHRDGNWNHIPVLNLHKEIIFLKVWVYRGITNLDIMNDDPFDLTFEKPERFYLVN